MYLHLTSTPLPDVKHESAERNPLLRIPHHHMNAYGKSKQIAPELSTK